MLDAPYRLRTLSTVPQPVCRATNVAVSWMLQSQFSLSVVVISASFRLSLGLRLNQGIVGLNSLPSFYLFQFQKDIEQTWNKLGLDLDARKRENGLGVLKVSVREFRGRIVKITFT